MNKLKLGIIFGGMSTEHDVSVVSATSVIESLNKEKYDIYPIYIDSEGNWYKYTKKVDDIKILELNQTLNEIELIKEPIEVLKQMDVVFPVLHGLYGEDGTIQGLLELIKVPYVGCKVLASAVSMDKAYTKIIFERAGLKQVKYEYVKKFGNTYKYFDKKFNEEELKLDELCVKITNNLKFPMFIKPSNSGSSVGIKKAKSLEDLKEAIKFAGQFDEKILIEEGIEAIEVECAVLGGSTVKASCIGEILPAEDFYSYEAKYTNSESKVIIPADISSKTAEKIKIYAIKAFNAVDGTGLARVDFFIEKETNEIYINEINTMPGFTKISMYPKLWEASGVSYSDLLDELVDEAKNEQRGRGLSVHFWV